MDKFVVQGGYKLKGNVPTSGAKNSVLPLMFACLLAEGEHVLHNVPLLQDVESAGNLLIALNCDVTRENKTLRIKVKNINLRKEFSIREIISVKLEKYDQQP